MEVLVFCLMFGLLVLMVGKAVIPLPDITNQYFRKLLKEFKNSPYLDYNKKQVYNEPTEA